MGINSLLDESGMGWDVLPALAINDQGWIVGISRDQQGHYSGIVLTPVPEPSTLVTVAVSLLALLARGGKLRKEVRFL